MWTTKRKIINYSNRARNNLRVNIFNLLHQLKHRSMCSNTDSNTDDEHEVRKFNLIAYILDKSLSLQGLLLQ